VHDGGIYVHHSMAASLTEKLRESPEPMDRDPFQTLTNRELEILTYLAQGYTNKEIAEKVFLSVKTVETHRSKIYSKLDIESRAELVHFAIKHHLLNV
jgi:two-component system response regulator NreC